MKPHDTEDTKGVVRSCKLKHKQYSGQKKKDKQITLCIICTREIATMEWAIIFYIHNG